MSSDKGASDVRERRKAGIKIGNDGTSTSSMKKPRARLGMGPMRCFFALFFVSLLLFSFTLLMGRLPWSRQVHATKLIDTLALRVGLQQQVYAIIFDAGSTGTRILVFTFHRIKADGSLKLDKEFFKEIKPGLSYYASNPSKAADSLRPLLEKAKELIPREYWNQTSLVLKATAGLRLLPGDMADSILTEVRAVFKTTPFLINENSVSIMEGRDEGLFSWFTVNFLLDKLGGDDTVACLDLGGGSTQVTFVNRGTSKPSPPPDHVHSVTIFSRLVELYSHSYLGLGLMAARLAILKAGNTTKIDSNQRQHYSPCFHPSIEKRWDYANKEHIITGSNVPTVPTIKGASASKDNKVPRFDACIGLANQIVNAKVHPPTELLEQEVYAISYYFDRATESGLIDPFEGGVIPVSQYFQAAKHACSHPNSEQPFECMDLSYISSFLSQGLGLKVSTPVTLRKKLNNHEISWALGAAFHVLTNDNVKS